MAKKIEIKAEDQQIVIKSPMRKSIYGFCVLVAATIVYYTWLSVRDSSSLVDYSLLGLCILLAIVGVYRSTTMDVTMLRRGQKSFLRRTYHFGLIRRDTAFTFDYLDITPRDIYFGIWSIRASLDEKHLAELDITQQDRDKLGFGATLIDGFSRKDANVLRKELEDFSGVSRRKAKENGLK